MALSISSIYSELLQIILESAVLSQLHSPNSWEYEKKFIAVKSKSSIHFKLTHEHTKAINLLAQSDIKFSRAERETEKRS